MKPGLNPTEQRGFTLIELLAVMLIMAIISAITMASFIGLTRGATLAGGARNVQSAIKLARQYAVTKRIDVAFLVLDPEFASDNGIAIDEETAQWIGRSYAVYDLRNNEYLKPWTKLPGNAVFAMGSPSVYGANLPMGDHILAKSRKDSQVGIPDIPYPAVYSPDDGDCYGIVFGPDGKMKKEGGGSNWYLWVMIYEGTFDGTTTQVRPNSIVYGIKVSHAGGAQLVEF